MKEIGMNPYESGQGDSLVDDALYPPLIIEYRENERTVLAELVDKHDWRALIEVGCMDGLHTEWTLAAGLDYIGVDVIERYVRAARQKWNEAAAGRSRIPRFFHLDAADVHTLDIDVKPAVGYYPFNSLGNMAAPTLAIQAIARLGVDAIVTTYSTEPRATMARMEYYAAAGFHQLHGHDNAEGVRISGSSGLSTIAYERAYLTALADEVYEDIEVIEFSTVGVLFLLRGSRTCVVNRPFDT